MPPAHLLRFVAIRPHPSPPQTHLSGLVQSASPSPLPPQAAPLAHSGQLLAEFRRLCPKLSWPGAGALLATLAQAVALPALAAADPVPPHAPGTPFCLRGSPRGFIRPCPQMIPPSGLPLRLPQKVTQTLPKADRITSHSSHPDGFHKSSPVLMFHSSYVFTGYFFYRHFAAWHCAQGRNLFFTWRYCCFAHSPSLGSCGPPPI